MKKIFILLVIYSFATQAMDRFDSLQATLDVLSDYPFLPGENALHHLTSIEFVKSEDLTQIISKLLSQGVDVSLATNRKKRTPLHYAVKRGKIEFIPLFVNHKPEIIDQQDIDGQTALHLAARAKCFDTVYTLLQSKANPGVRNNKGELPIHFIIEDGQYNKSIFAPDKSTFTPGGIRSWRVTKNLIELFCLFMSTEDVKQEFEYVKNVLRAGVITKDKNDDYKNDYIENIHEPLRQNIKQRSLQEDPFEASRVLADQVSQQALGSVKAILDENEANEMVLARVMQTIINRNFCRYLPKTVVGENTIYRARLLDERGSQLNQALEKNCLNREDLLVWKDRQQSKPQELQQPVVREEGQLVSIPGVAVDISFDASTQTYLAQPVTKIPGNPRDGDRRKRDIGRSQNQAGKNSAKKRQLNQIDWVSVTYDNKGNMQQKRASQPPQKQLRVTM